LHVLPAFVLLALSMVVSTAMAGGKYDPTQVALEGVAQLDVGEHDWPQWGGWHGKNNTPVGTNIPGDWNIDDGTNIKWSVQLGSQTYGNPVVANGRVYVGTNNGAGYLSRFPAAIDLGCLLCFEEKTGKFLWQHSSTKLPVGRVNDWPLQGICDAPFVDGQRLWFVTSRGEVLCLDTEGFLDGENDGPYSAEPNENKDEADVVWKFDMMGRLGVFQHNMCSCSVTCAGDVLLVNTSNGVDASHINLPSPKAPSFLALNRNTGEILWTDDSPGTNILHGQWSSPTYAVLGGQPQAIFGGGDGWLYSFDPAGDGEGNSKLLWKFDCNPKEAKWILGGRGTRNNIIATAVVYDGLVYCAVGQDPEHGEGPGHIWCVDPTKRGDVSPELAFGADGKPLPHRRLQAVNTADGERTKPNPNSAAVWHYHQAKKDLNGDGRIDFEETMHRSCGTVAIKDDILFIADFNSLLHCLDAKTGEAHWSYDMFSAAWGSPLIVDGKVFIGNEDGDLCIFGFSKDPKQAMKVKEKSSPDGPDRYEPLNVIFMNNAIYSTPIVANNVLYVANKSTLFAIEAEAE